MWRRGLHPLSQFQSKPHCAYSHRDWSQNRQSCRPPDEPHSQQGTPADRQAHIRRQAFRSSGGHRKSVPSALHRRGGTPCEWRRDAREFRRRSLRRKPHRSPKRRRSRPVCDDEWAAWRCRDGSNGSHRRRLLPLRVHSLNPCGQWKPCRASWPAPQIPQSHPAPGQDPRLRSSLRCPHKES